MKKSFYLPIFLILLSAVSIFAQSETEKGIEHYRNGDFDSAISVLGKVVQTDKNDRKAWTYLGGSLAKRGKDKEAHEAFLKADSILLKNLTEKELLEFDDGLKIISKPRANYTDLYAFPIDTKQ